MSSLDVLFRASVCTNIYDHWQVLIWLSGISAHIWLAGNLKWVLCTCTKSGNHTEVVGADQNHRGLWKWKRVSLHWKRVRKLNHHWEQVMAIYRNTVFSISKHALPKIQSLNSNGKIRWISLNSTAVRFWKNELTLHIFICFIFSNWFSRTVFCLCHR